MTNKLFQHYSYIQEDFIIFYMLQDSRVLSCHVFLTGGLISLHGLVSFPSKAFLPQRDGE